MYCKECGKKIDDHAKFCNFCGARVTSVQPGAASAQQAAARPVQPQPAPQAAAQPVQPQSAPQAAAPKKKSGNKGLVILIILIILGAIGYFSEAYLNGELDNTFVSDIFGKKDDTSLTASCTYGAVYQNGYLTYGKARIYVPGCTLQKGSGTVSDYLITESGTGIIRVDNPVNFNEEISYNASTAEGIKNSFIFSDFTDVEIVEFKKYKVDGYPVIQYIASGNVDGTPEYFGELIVFPSEKTNTTLRFSMEMLATDGYYEMTVRFDSLIIDPDFILTMDDTQTIGETRIIAK